MSALCRAVGSAGLAYLSLFSSVGRAQAPARMTVEWQDAPLSQVVDAMARFSGSRIVVAPDIGEYQISVALTNIDWRSALDSILRMHALVARTDSLRVVHVERRISMPARSGSSPATPIARLVAVEKDVRLEVIDWGGSGRSLVLLTGLGGVARDLEQFALALAPYYHVYGITRRGFGASSAPSNGYAADRLGNDVLAAIDSLQLKSPILAGHSFGGAELSSIGSRHPEKVAGLIYLDAGYPYAFYNAARGNFQIDLNELRTRLEQLELARGPGETRRVISELLETDMPALERSIRELLAKLPPAPPGAPTPATPPRFVGVQPSPALDAIRVGMQRYTTIKAPVLAIFALPHRPPPAIARDSAVLSWWLAGQAEWPAQAEAFQRGLPSARVVFLPNTDHALFLLENFSDVLREINAFASRLPVP